MLSWILLTFVLPFHAQAADVICIHNETAQEKALQLVQWETGTARFLVIRGGEPSCVPVTYADASYELKMLGADKGACPGLTAIGGQWIEIGEYPNGEVGCMVRTDKLGTKAQFKSIVRIDNRSTRVKVLMLKPLLECADFPVPFPLPRPGDYVEREVGWFNGSGSCYRSALGIEVSIEGERSFARPIFAFSPGSDRLGCTVYGLEKYLSCSTEGRRGTLTIRDP
ncbi:MAG TPA: hypothetical protein VIH99_05420 [Bdellovibrionota bacterium]|jgi:hypothetical protein